MEIFLNKQSPLLKKSVQLTKIFQKKDVNHSKRGIENKYMYSCLTYFYLLLSMDGRSLFLKTLPPRQLDTEPNTTGFPVF